MDSLNVGKTYVLRAAIAERFAEATVRALAPAPYPQGLPRPRVIGKLAIHSVVLEGTEEAGAFGVRRRIVAITFQVLENPLPLVAAIAIILGAATFLAISGTFLVREVKEVVSSPAGAVAATSIGLGAVALAVAGVFVVLKVIP